MSFPQQKLLNYRKLNNYHYEEEWDDIINYKLNNILAKQLDVEKQKSFVNKYKPFHISSHPPALMYQSLIVLPKHHIEEALQEIYDDPKQGIGHGQQQFYSIINSTFLNVTPK